VEKVFDSKYWSKEVKRKKMPKFSSDGEDLRIADFFSGCGGLTLGALIACSEIGRKLKIAAAVDIWQEASVVYEKNFGKFIEDASVCDLSTMVTQPGSIELTGIGEKFAKQIGGLDVIVAGPPCQGHSDLNNSSRRDDPRNLLYTIPVAFALRLQAKILILENVPTVVHSSDGVVNSAFKALENDGYAVGEFYADAQDFGLPQTRRRHLLVASRIHDLEHLKRIFDSVKKRSTNVELWPFIKDLETESETSSLMTKRSKIMSDNIARIEYLFRTNSFDLPDEFRPPCHRDKVHSYMSMYGRLHADRPAQTITSGFGSMGQGRFVHPTQPRMITAHEAARIQGFPDYFKFDVVTKITALREMIGNAVPPAISAVLLMNLLKSHKASNSLDFT
jgi:DNA (cytosine-5)-methyltransferase 1